MDENPTPERPTILVWDAPVRVFHWLLAASFVGAYVTAEAERWLLLHVTLGYTVGALVAFRLLWGLVGTRHARFASFVRGPAAVADYLRSLLGRHPEPSTGHNPAGGWAIVALLILAALSAATGWATYVEAGGEWFEDLHEALSNAMLALVVVHVGAVLLSSRLHRENLVRSMITGRKQGRPDDAIGGSWRSVAALLVAAVLGFWSWQWTQAPGADQASAYSRHADDDRHGDGARRRHDDD